VSEKYWKLKTVWSLIVWSDVPIRYIWWTVIQSCKRWCNLHSGLWVSSTWVAETCW